MHLRAPEMPHKFAGPQSLCVPSLLRCLRMTQTALPLVLLLANQYAPHTSLVPPTYYHTPNCVHVGRP